MRNRLIRNLLGIGAAAAVSMLLSFLPTVPVRAAELPATIADARFWQMVTELSEPGGVFQQELMSNEDSAQAVIPALKAARGSGVYIGVGPEQNFTYIAAVQPKLAFVVDIRRENMLQHLLYKALFELSVDRAEFVSRLFSRTRPPGLDARSGVGALFDAYRAADADTALYDDTIKAVIDRLTGVHKFPLTDADRAVIARLLQTFRVAGPANLKGSGDKNLTYEQAMTATDPNGAPQSYLASEESFRFVQDLERRNLIVPLVGDFAGDRTLVGIGRYLREQDATVGVFYVSNVERYLFDQGEHGRRFYANASSLPLAPTSTFIRSVTRDISVRLGIPIPDAAVNWWTFLTPMRTCLDAVASGRVENYRQLFECGN